MLDEIYPDSKSYGIDINSLVPSDYLRSYIDKLENVVRFQHPKNHIIGMIKDDTKIHTLRCVYRSLTFPYTNEELTKILWIHDVPECESVKDTSAVERYHNKKQSKDVEDNEDILAGKILNSEDYERFKQFIIAEDFVRRSGNIIPQNQQAIVANVIDFIDGNLVSVYFFTRWLLTNKYDGVKPTEKVLHYNVDIVSRTKNAIKNPGLNKEIVLAVNYVINSELKAVLNLWSKVPQNKIPPIMLEEIEKIRKFV